MDALQVAGGAAFGAVVGWTTYFILRRAQPKTLSDITTFIGAIGGAAVTTLFDSKGDVFAGYAIGLAIGFFAYYVVFLLVVGKSAVREPIVMAKSAGQAAGAPASGTVLGGTPQPQVAAKTGEVMLYEVDWGADRSKKK